MSEAGRNAMEKHEPALKRPGRRRFEPRRALGMLIVSQQLGSKRARAALTFILFLAIWLLLSIPDAFAATGVRKSSFTYDSASGLLLTETVEPDDANFAVTTTYTHDAFGNTLTATTSGAGVSSRTTTSTFETNGRFALTTANALSHSQSVVTDPKFGNPTSQTGPNGLTTTWTYDSFGRPTLETRPDGNKTAYAYAYCSGVAGGSASCPSHGAYVTTVTPKNSSNVQNGPWVKTYHDTHGRVIATDTQGFAGQTIRQASEYDALGRMSKQSRPYFLSGGTPAWTTFAYDALGRQTSITLPDSSQSTFAYNGLTTSVTNDKNQTETTLKNARGEIVSVTDANSKTTSFTYGAFGNRTSITDSAGNIGVMIYDTVGRKIASVDPDLGEWEYEYNVLGELISQTDAKNQTITTTYDKLGRPLTRNEDGETSTWVYDTATKGVGKLHTASSTNGYLRTQAYDSLGRPSSEAVKIDGVTETVTTTYDANSRINRVTFPSGFSTQYVYTSLGYASQLKEYGGSTLWTANTVDAELRWTQATAGNGVVTNRTFNANRGFIADIEAGTSGSVADYAYTFDTIGNLTYRIDSNQGVAENFTYDVLNRLKTYSIAGGSSKSLTYDDLGNITSKSDVGSYTYAAAGTARPHAVISAGASTYYYDNNGNMTSGGGRTIAWTDFNKIASVTQGATSMSWEYGPERQRIKQSGPAGDTYYYGDRLGAHFEKHVGTSETQWNEYLFVGGEMVGVHFTKSASADELRYFVKDHLGSVAVITNEAGGVVERLAYDAWGKRRYPNGADDPTGSLTSLTTRGFTGHEMIDDIGIVNMNGRVYDPALGRFMSADPMIHDVTNSQDLNRYSYVHNNPLSYTDMNGYGFFKKLGRFFKKIFKPLLAIAIALTLQFELLPIIYSGPLFGSQFLTGAVTAGISGGVSNVVLTGKPKSFLTGFGQSFATFGVGHGIFAKANVAFGKPGYFGKAIAHGVVGGAFAEVRGGSFKSGFLAAGFSSAAAPLGPQGSLWKGAAFHAAVGGAGSVLGGGKFADGAVTGAFTYLFNDAVEKLATNDEIEAAREIAIKELSEWLETQDVSEGVPENGAYALYNRSTKEITYMYGSDAGTAIGDSEFEFSIKFTSGEDVLLATAHTHPKIPETGILRHSARRNNRLNNRPSSCPRGCDMETLYGLKLPGDPTDGAAVLVRGPSGNVAIEQP